MYSYFNVGFSNASFFPDYRLGFSLYRNLPKSFEAEVGIRYLKFNSPTIIYTGSIGKYYSNFWFSLRPYLIPGNEGLSRSLSLITRYYLKGGSDNYLTLTVGSGISPDQFTRNINLEAPNVSSQNIRLGFQHLFLKRYIFSTGVGYRNDEFRKGSFRENYNFNTSLEMFF